MKVTKKTWIIGFISLAAGMLLGWFIFTPHQQSVSEEAHQHAAGKTIWTCSMHPQIRQNEPGLCPICGMELIPLEKSSSETPQALEMTPTAVQLANIQTTEVRKAEAQKEIQLNGRVKADETRIFSQTAHFAGRIERLYIDYTGKYVRRGEKLAAVYSPELITAQQELFEAKEYYDINPTLYQAAKNKLKLWKLSDAQIQSIEEKGQIINNFPIRADVSGYVIEKKVNLGDHLDEGEVMFQIADLSKVWVMFEAYESDLAWLKKGDQVDFTVSSLPGKHFEAQVNFIDPVIDPVKRVAMVRAEVSNREKALKPEMFVKGTISTSLKESIQSLIIPETAVMWTGKRSIVYIKVPDTKSPTFRMKEITLGEKLGEFYMVNEGLEEGDQVVSNGTFTVDAAAQLKGLPSMMNPDTENDHSQHVASVQSHAPEVFREQLSNLYHAYLDLNEALIASNATKAASEAGQMQVALQQIKGSSLGNNASQKWVNYRNQMNKEILAIKAASSLEKQREALDPLSHAMYEAIKTFGLNEKVYYQYCPMAGSDKGAYWLSREEEIRNPYFGESMLGCGNTEEVIKSNK